MINYQYYLVDLIEKIRKRPTMYIGEPNIFCLKAYLDGWLAAADDPAGESNRWIVGFQAWIQERFRVESAQSWAKIIAFWTPDQYAAMVEALALFEEYAASRRDPGASPWPPAPS